MKPEARLVTVLLIILGVGDLAFVPVMIAASHHTPGTPPVAAIVLGALIGVATLVSAFGVAQGRRSGFLVAMVCRILDCLTSVMGALFGPNATLKTGGVLVIVLSIAAIVLLVRADPRRAARLAAGRPARAPAREHS